MKYTLAQRLTQIIEAKFPNQDFMSITTQFNVNYDSMRRVKSGATPLGAKILNNVIAMIPEVNLNYLFFEEGEYFRQEDGSMNNSPFGLSTKNVEDIIGDLRESLEKHLKSDTNQAPADS